MDLFFHQISSDDSSSSSSNDLSSEKNDPKQSYDSTQNDFVSPPTTYHLSMNEHLSHITTVITQKTDSNSDIITDDFTDEDFLLDQMNKPFTLTKRQPLESVASVVCMIADPQNFTTVDSSFTRTRPSLISWKNLNTSSSSDFLGSLVASYKNEYMRLSPVIRFIPFVSPNVDKMNTLSNIRRECCFGRALFHYIGYGLPEISKGSLNLIDGRGDNLRPYPIEKLLENYSPPSWFIFDCNNAEAALNGLFRASRELSFSEDKKKSDWFCLCATSLGEELPIDPCLPRDFLTTCLFTPISLSILCHILQYYRTTFLTSSYFPFSNIEELLLASNDKQLDLTLSTITDAIAASYLSPSIYHRFFYQDKLISTFFKNFILAQFLLAPYEVHPVSVPAIPSTVSHPLWRQWQASLDLWITSTTTPRPSFATNFFNRSVVTFKTFMNNEKTKSKIDLALLTILARYPTTHLNGCCRAVTLLAEYSSLSTNNRKKIANVIVFNDLFSKLISHDTESEEEYQSLSYLILSLLQLDLNFSSLISTDLNFAILPSFIFDGSINEITRSLLSAILSAIVIFNRTLRQICASAEFINAAKDAIQDAKTSQFILWLLILLKRSFSLFSADFSCFYNCSSHIQIAVCLFHQDPQVRAAAISALSCFMQSNECTLNLHLILFSISLFDDVSYLVRYQLLLLLSRFMSSIHSPLGSSSETPSPILSSSYRLHSFHSLLSLWLYSEKVPKEFSEYAMAVDKIAHLEDALNYVVGIVYYLVDYFIHDPHPSISKFAIKMKMFLNEEIKSSESTSVSSPFTSLKMISNSFDEDELSETPTLADQQRSFGFQKENLSQSRTLGSNLNSKEQNSNKQPNTNSNFESDSDALYNIAVRHLVNHAQWQIKEEDSVAPKKRNEKDNPFGSISLPALHLTKTNEMKGINVSKLVYHPRNLQFAVATTVSSRSKTQQEMKSQSSAFFNLNGSQQEPIGNSHVYDTLSSSTSKFPRPAMNRIGSHSPSSFDLYSLSSPFIKSPPSQPVHSKINSMNHFHHNSSSNNSHSHHHHNSNNNNSNNNESDSSTHFSPSSMLPQIGCKSCIFAFKDDMTVMNNIVLSNSPISDMNYNMIGDVNVISAATIDGCCYLWNPRYNNAFASFRVDSNYQSDNVPTYMRLSSSDMTIATARGGDGLALWDIKTMKLIGEWQCGDDEEKKATGIAMHPGNQSVCTIGFDNGGFTAIDTRSNETILTVSIGEKIIGLAENIVHTNLIYAATKSGRCLAWDMKTNNLTPCGNQKMKAYSFDAHFSLPIFGFSAEDDCPVVTTTDAKCTVKVNDVSQRSIISFHPILPVVSFGSPTGIVQTFNISLDDSQAK